MTHSASLQVELLDKIGAPLVSAIESVKNDAGQALSDDAAATLIAQMLGQSVQSAIALSANVTMPDNMAEADSARLGLAGVMAQVIADFYSAHGKAPAESDINRFIKSAQSVIAFSENFSAAKGQEMRLSLLGTEGILFDELQLELVMMQMMTPVILAVSEFPFGQSETKLLQEILDKLKIHAKSTVDAIGSNGHITANKISELMALKSFAQIYAHCHKSETDRLAVASDAEREKISIESIWSLFEKQLALVEVASGIKNNYGAQGGSDDVLPTPVVTAVSAPVAQAVVETPAVIAPAQPVIQPVTPPPAEVAAPPVEAAPPAAAGGGPMSFFSGPKEAPAVAAAPVAATPVAPPAAPVTQPVTQAPTSPLASQVASVAEKPVAVDNSNPMSFFKPGTKAEE